MGAAAPPCLSLQMWARLPSNVVPNVAHGEWDHPTKQALVLDGD